MVATTASDLLPKMQKPTAENHFPAIEEAGSHILEALYKNGLQGRYTRIKNEDTDIYEVPDLKQIQIQHPYSTDYFARDRVTKIPTSYEHEVPYRKSISRKGELTRFRTQPTCYLGMYLAPRLISFLGENDYSLHVIAIQPFRFYPPREKDACTFALQKLSVHRGRLTVVIANAVREQDNMTMKIAFERVFEMVADQVVFSLRKEEFYLNSISIKHKMNLLNILRISFTLIFKNDNLKNTKVTTVYSG